jgi:thiamine-phosphate pyrophosphorylase
MPGRLTPLRLPRLYPILDVDLSAARGLPPLDLLDAWLAAGVRIVQVRAKEMASGPFLDLVRLMRARTEPDSVRLIINDRADIARLSGADGVHVGQHDLRPADARSIVGPGAIVGLSTHTDAQISRALFEPASYLAIGPVFETTSKRNPDPVVGLEGVSRAAAIAATSGRPLVAIGGIRLAHAAAVIAAGAATIAVISDLIGDDPGRRVRAFIDALPQDPV